MSHEVAQHQINVETTLCTSTLKFTTFSNFKVELNNVRQRRNNIVIFNVNFHNVGQRQNNVANMTIWKKISLHSTAKQYFWASRNILDSKSSSILPILRGICKIIFVEPQKFLKHQIYWIAKIIFKPSHFVKC